ncbi:hypothetical protein WG66_005000 [Moniliophthora roreri]|uniref:Uncharacterized protein n=1 Tax=Moniliophthora roreri TaxID=221103 RepID=A0A0W0EV64_MONRR|nr:hypothetical protein WG66_005000 [Moniliophthora roreri]
MSFAGGFDSSDAWAPPQAGDIIAEAMKKEKVLKELAASQEDLRGGVQRSLKG